MDASVLPLDGQTRPQRMKKQKDREHEEFVFKDR